MREPLEPGCTQGENGYARSQAISLKRIADRLDEMDKIGGITHSLERMATEYERQNRS